MARPVPHGLLWVACVLGLGWGSAGCFVRTGPELPSNIGVSTARRQAQQRQDDFGKSPEYEGAGGAAEEAAGGSPGGHDGEAVGEEHGSHDGAPEELQPLQLPSFARSRQSAGVPPPRASHGAPDLPAHAAPDHLVDHRDEGPEHAGPSEPAEPIEAAPEPIE